MKKILLTVIIGLINCIIINAQTTIKDSIMHGGISRYFTLYVPAVYNPGKPAPLVFNLHGLNSNGTEQMAYADFRPIADTANFILVVPEGTTSFLGQFWNVDLQTSKVDDSGFLTALIDTLSNEYNINSKKIYTTGMSNGGFMSYYLACHTNSFAAIASVTGSMVSSNFAECSPSHLTPVMEIHGTADNTVPYAGSTYTKSIEDVIKYWVTFNNSNPVPVITNIPDINVSDGATAQHFFYSAGDSAVSVELYKIINGGHTWPGSAYTVGTTCQDFNACKEIWRFFNSYTISTIASTGDYAANKNKVIIYPNPANSFIVLSSQFSVLRSSTVSIFDITGKEVYKIASTGTEMTHKIDISSLPPNIYFLTIKTSDEINTYKIVKY